MAGVRLSRFLTMRRISRSLAIITLVASALVSSFANETGTTIVADGFALPVGLAGTKKYYKARGFRTNGHLGEDWNGEGGGDTDLGDPVYSTAHGLVVFAQDYRLGWGNVVIVRHAYFGRWRSEVRRFSLRAPASDPGTRGAAGPPRPAGRNDRNNRGCTTPIFTSRSAGIYRIGMHRSAFARDFSNTGIPLSSSPLVPHWPEADGYVPINTFPAAPLRPMLRRWRRASA